MTKVAASRNSAKPLSHSEYNGGKRRQMVHWRENQASDLRNKYMYNNVLQFFNKYFLQIENIISA